MKRQSPLFTFSAFVILLLALEAQGMCGRFHRDVPPAPSTTTLFPLVSSSSFSTAAKTNSNQPKLFRVSNCVPTRPNVHDEDHVDLQNWLIPTKRRSVDSKPQQQVQADIDRLAQIDLQGKEEPAGGRVCDYNEITSFGDLIAVSRITTGNKVVHRHSYRVNPELVQVEWPGLEQAVLEFKEKLWPNDTRLNGLEPRLQAVLSYQGGDSFGWHEDLCEERGQEGVLIVDLGFRRDADDDADFSHQHDPDQSQKKAYSEERIRYSHNDITSRWTTKPTRHGTIFILGVYFILALGFYTWASRCKRSNVGLFILFLSSALWTAYLIIILSSSSPIFDHWRSLRGMIHDVETDDREGWGGMEIRTFRKQIKHRTHNNHLGDLYGVPNEFRLNSSSSAHAKKKNEEILTWSASSPGSWVAFHMHQMHMVGKIPAGRRRVVAVYTLVAPYLRGRFLCSAYSGSCPGGPYGMYRPGVPVLKT